MSAYPPIAPTSPAPPSTRPTLRTALLVTLAFLSILAAITRSAFQRPFTLQPFLSSPAATSQPFPVEPAKNGSDADNMSWTNQTSAAAPTGKRSVG